MVSMWQRTREWALRLVGSVRHGRSDADLAAELQSHLDLAAEATRASAPPHDTEAALRRTRLRISAPFRLARGRTPPPHGGLPRSGPSHRVRCSAG